MIIFSKILVVIFISHEPIKNYSRHGISTSFTRKSINNSTYRCENKTWFTLHQFNHNRMVFQIRSVLVFCYIIRPNMKTFLARHNQRMLQEPKPVERIATVGLEWIVALFKEFANMKM